MGILASRLDFGKKLKALRSAYELNNATLSRYCTIFNESIISTAAISYWENGKRMPAADSVLLLANIFAVNINWLISFDDYPEKPIYDEIRLEYLESKLIERSQNYMIRGEVFEFPYFRELSEEYLVLEQRKEEFTFEARANIIFLMYVIDFEWQRYIKANITEFKSVYELTVKNILMRGVDFLMTAPGDLHTIGERVVQLKKIMETKKPLYKVRW